MNQSVLVIGGAGQFGSRVCEAIAGHGGKPIAFDDLSTGHGDRVKWGPLVKVDVRETPRVVRTLKEYNAREIVHCALVRNVEDPSLLYSQHLESLMSLLKAMQENGGGRLTIVSEGTRDQDLLERIANDTAKVGGFTVRFLTSLADDEVLRRLCSDRD